MCLQIGMYIYNASPHTNVYTDTSVTHRPKYSRLNQRASHCFRLNEQSTNGKHSCIMGQVCAFLQREEVDKAKSTAVLFNLDSERPRHISERWEPHSPIDCCEIQRDTALLSVAIPLSLWTEAWRSLKTL